MVKPSIILNTDSYKLSHWVQYPKNTKFVSSYIEARGMGAPFRNFTDSKELEIVHFGLQMFLDTLSIPVTNYDINEAEDIVKSHGFDFNRSGWEYIVNVYGGKLPLRIKALDEGSIVPIGTPQVQVDNTDSTCFWLTSYIETAFLRAVWYPSTIATLSRETKKLIYDYLKITSDDPEGQIMFKLHDFGARGVSSEESAMIGGTAHLVNFMGTDTISGLTGARRFYNADMAGFSIPAAEHSTITAWGRDREKEAYENMLDNFAKTGKLVAVVSDSYDIYNAVEKIWGEELKEKILASGATLVVRPDSGKPVKVTLKVLELLGEKFGYALNSKGFKVLNPAVRVIWGDGIAPDDIGEILFHIASKKWSADNIAFGMGGGLLQKVNRDSLKYAMKANAMDFGKDWVDIWKEPVTDTTKSSKKGRVAVIRENDIIKTIREDELGNRENLLKDVFVNGNVVRTIDFDTVRKNARLTS